MLLLQENIQTLMRIRILSDLKIKMANNFNPWNQDSVKVKQEPELQSTEIKSEIIKKSLVNPGYDSDPGLDEVKQESGLESTEIKSEITEKSLANPDFKIEVKQESELVSVEIKSEITEKSLVNHDLVEVKQESKRSERFYPIKCINAMYKCNICGKSFRTEYGRRDHLKTCQNQRSKNLKKIMQKHIKLSKHA